MVAKVAVPYTAVKDNQLSLELGQLIHVLDQDTSGWWKGQLHVSQRHINNKYVTRPAKSTMLA